MGCKIGMMVSLEEEVGVSVGVIMMVEERR